MNLRMRALLIVLFVALAVQMLVESDFALADEGGIELVESSAESQFPDSVRFYVKARSLAEIDEVRVFFRRSGSIQGTAYRAVEFETGMEVAGEAILLSGTGSNYIPPGTVIEYSFEIRDKAGGVLRTPEKEMMYTDHRFDWKTLSSGLITVYYYGKADKEKARLALEAAAQATERMAMVLGIEITEPLRILTYTNYTDMTSAIPFRSHAVSEQLITEGMAFSDERVLLVHSPDMAAGGTVSHEFTHLLVAQAAGRAHGLVPAWLNEGLAEYGSISPEQGFDDALRRAISSGRLNPLWYQGKFGGKPGDIIIAYGQASSVVKYLISEYGSSKIADLLGTLQTTHDIDKALQRVYGFDQHGLDAEWRQSLGLEPLESPDDRPSEQPMERADSVQDTPIATPTARPAPSGTTGTAAQDEEKRAGSPGCGATLGGGNVADPVALFLLVGPLGALAGRGVLGRRWY